MNTAFAHNATATTIASALTGKTVRYLANKSKLKADGVRVFKIDSVQEVSFGKKSGKRYVNVHTTDIDDAGEQKYRNLQLEGIDLVV